MPVESGLHKFLGVYRELPDLLKRAGVATNDLLHWVDELAFYDPDVGPAFFGVAPLYRPIHTLWSTLTNTHFIPTGEKAKLAAMTVAGLKDYADSPEMLDRYSVADYARQHGVGEEIIRRVLFTATQAVLFMAADQFSAYAFFAPAAEAAKRGLTFRLGAFRGGMTETMIQPIAKAIEDRGGKIRSATRVTRLIVENQRVVGVATEGESLRAQHVVVATPLHVAQDLLRPVVGEHPWFQPMLKLETLSAATIQFELDSPLFETDHTNFSPTCLCCFAEQSHTTFTHLPGRLSAILFPPEEFISLPAEAVAERVYRDAERLGLPLREKVRNYRVVHHPHDFYAMKPGSEALRPLQHTPIRGLLLAGDYTKQPFVASMEGATISGRKAAEAILAS
jgi:15-cis-phytoene desaturase